MSSPPLGYLVNAALALGAERMTSSRMSSRARHTLRADRPGPPAPETFWRRPYRPPELDPEVGGD